MLSRMSVFPAGTYVKFGPDRDCYRCIFSDRRSVNGWVLHEASSCVVCPSTLKKCSTDENIWILGCGRMENYDWGCYLIGIMFSESVVLQLALGAWIRDFSIENFKKKNTLISFEFRFCYEFRIYRVGQK